MRFQNIWIKAKISDLLPDGLNSSQDLNHVGPYSCDLSPESVQFLQGRNSWFSFVLARNHYIIAPWPLKQTCWSDLFSLMDTCNVTEQILSLSYLNNLSQLFGIPISSCTQLHLSSDRPVKNLIKTHRCSRCHQYFPTSTKHSRLFHHNRAPLLLASLISLIPCYFAF